MHNMPYDRLSTVLAVPLLADKLNVVERGLIDTMSGLSGMSSHAGISVRQRYMKNLNQTTL